MTSSSDWETIGNNICLSGGANGADLQWGMQAGKYGHRVFHFIFNGHKSKAPESEKVVLSDAQLRMADPYLSKANDTLKRKWPLHNKWTTSLLRRNFYQVCDAQAVYAVSTINKFGVVEGGTSWAVQMFLDRFDKLGVIPAYVFDQSTETWYQWDNGWMPIEMPPTPTGVYAGIGTRQLSDQGKLAIRLLYM